MTVLPISPGRRVPAEVFHSLTEGHAAAKAAREEAEAILAAAHADARAIREEAELRAQAREAELSAISDETLASFVDTHAIDEVAEAVILMLREAERVREDFDALEPWIGGLIGTALERILGAVPPEELWTGLLRRGLAETRERWDLTLRCHPADTPRVERVVAADPLFARAIREVQGDEALSVGDAHLVGARGLLDIGVRTQVAAILRAATAGGEPG